MKANPKTSARPMPAPRNPWVAACRFRQAGAHRRGNARAQALRELRRDLKDWLPRGP